MFLCLLTCTSFCHVYLRNESCLYTFSGACDRSRCCIFYWGSGIKQSYCCITEIISLSTFILLESWWKFEGVGVHVMAMLLTPSCLEVLKSLAIKKKFGWGMKWKWISFYSYSHKKDHWWSHKKFKLELGLSITI